MVKENTSLNQNLEIYQECINFPFCYISVFFGNVGQKRIYLKYLYIIHQEIEFLNLPRATLTFSPPLPFKKGAFKAR